MFITLLAKRTAKVTPSETDSTVFQRHYAAAGRQKSRLSAVLGRRGVSAASRETRELGGEAVGALVHLAVSLEGESSRNARSVNPNRGTNLVLTLGALSRRAVSGVVAGRKPVCGGFLSWSAGCRRGYGRARFVDGVGQDLSNRRRSGENRCFRSCFA